MKQQWTSVSLTKARIRELRDLGRKKDRDATGRFVVDGVRGVREALHSRYEVLELLYTDALLATDAGRSLVGEAEGRVRAMHRLTPREMEQISDTVHAQGVLAVMAQMRWMPGDVLERGDRASVVVALDAVADPGNLGAIVRTCDWFGVNALMLGPGCVELYNPKVVRSTVGSIFHLPILAEMDLAPLVAQAKESGYTVFAADAGGEAYTDLIRYPGKSLLVLGNEARGVSDAVLQGADVRLAVRRYGAAESLNVGVACGVVLASIRNGAP